MATSRAVDMAALEGYAALLRSVGHGVQIITMDGKEMKRTRIKAARHIFEQCKKAKTFPRDSRFDESVVELGDINDAGNYYAGFIFTPSIARHMCMTARMTCAADAAHCDGVGTQSCGTTFGVLSYDANNQLTPLVFAHSVGPECYESWKVVFDACAELEGFDVESRTTIVDQEKSIDKAYRECFTNAKLFLDPLHVKKNLGPKLGAGKAIGLHLYEQAVHAPTVEALEDVRRQFTPEMRACLGRFEDSELYRAKSALQRPHLSIDGALSSCNKPDGGHRAEPHKWVRYADRGAIREPTNAAVLLRVFEGGNRLPLPSWCRRNIRKARVHERPQVY